MFAVLRDKSQVNYFYNHLSLSFSTANDQAGLIPIIFY